MKDFFKGLGASLLDVLKTMSIGLVMAIVAAIKGYFAKSAAAEKPVEKPEDNVDNK